MAVAVPDRLDDDLLRRQAEAFDLKAERLRAQAREFAQQAIELRLTAERQNRQPVPIMHQRIAPERDARLLAQTTALLEKIGPCSSTILAEHLNVTAARIRGVLLTLERSKVVKRSGIRRGTIWGLCDDADLSGNHRAASARSLVLSAGKKLDTFDIDALDAEIPMLTRAGIARAVRALVEEGAFTEAKDGRKKIYAYDRPESKPVNRPKHEPPEAKIVAFARRGGIPVQGTGRRVRSGTPIVDELLRELNDWPIVEIIKRKHKYSFKIDGREIASCSTTPGASGLAGTRRELNRAGIPV